MAKILVVDDDEAVRQTVKEWLEIEQHTVDLAVNGKEGLEHLRFYHYDAVVLDWGLPGISGIELLKQYRASGGTAPILMLTGKETLNDKTEGLDSGADDYLTKPFHVKELSSRLRALLRRPTALVATQLVFENLCLDTVSHSVSRNGRDIKLSPREFALLEYLMQHPNQCFAAEVLLDRLWSSYSDVSPESIRTFINRLRAKVDGDGETPLIHTIYGVGYKLGLSK